MSDENTNGSVGYLHIFAQYTYHDTAQIVGTRLGLETLAAAVAKALKYREAQSDAVFVNDGEGYTVEVHCVDDVGTDVPAPYTQDVASAEIGRWMERAFEAEAKLSKLRRDGFMAQQAVGGPLTVSRDGGKTWEQPEAPQ